MGKLLSRLTAFVLVIAFLVFIISPGIIGLGVRDATVRRAIELFPPETSQQLVFRETEFRGGWFSSSGALEVQYAPFGALGESTTFNVPYQVSHGPLLRSETGYQLGLAQAQLYPEIEESGSIAALQELPFDLPKSRVQVLTGFDQSTTVAFEIEPADYQNSAGELVFEGLNGTLLAYADRSADLSLSMGLLRAREPDTQAQLEVGGLSVQSHFDQIDNLLAPASARFTVNQIRSTGITDLSIARISGDSQLRAAAAGPDMIDIIQNFSLVDIDSEFPLDDLHFTLEIRELRREVARSYFDLVTEYQRQINSATVVTSTVAALSQELGLSLLRDGLILVNKIEASAYQGEHQASLDMNWDGLPQLGSLQQLDPAAIVAALTLQIDVSLDLNAVRRSPYADVVEAYVQGGYLKIEGDRVTLKGALADDELSLNGDTISLDQFIVQ